MFQQLQILFLHENHKFIATRMIQLGILNTILSTVIKKSEYLFAEIHILDSYYKCGHHKELFFFLYRKYYSVATN